jgi:hypothetical protein
MRYANRTRNLSQGFSICKSGFKFFSSDHIGLLCHAYSLVDNLPYVK